MQSQSPSRSRANSLEIFISRFQGFLQAFVLIIAFAILLTRGAAGSVVIAVIVVDLCMSFNSRKNPTIAPRDAEDIIRAG